MVSLETWLVFCMTEAVLCFTPGPAVMLVVSRSLTWGAAAGVRASLGILAANSMYFVLSATSLGAILLASWELFFLVKWLGAAYLVWLGARMILSTFTPGARRRGTPAGAPGASRGGSFSHGFLTQGANPKALVFFSAILPQFVNPAGPIGVQVAILGVSSVLIELAVLGLYVGACRSARGWAQHPRFAAWSERLGGLLLVGAGAQLAAIRRG